MKPAHGLWLVALAGCATVDGSYTRNAMTKAAVIHDPIHVVDPARTETPASDGGTFKIAGFKDNHLCFIAMVDNRGGLGTDRTYTLRAFVDGETPAIDTVESATVKLQREYTTPQPGATVTDQVVLTPDGQAGSIVQLGLVDYPVADLEVCFPWRKVPAGARYIVINRIDAAGERAAPSYGAWQVPP